MIALPSTTQEAWRYTNVSPIARLRFVDEPAGPIGDVEQLLHASGPRLVFVNGRHAPGLSELGDSVKMGMVRDHSLLGGYVTTEAHPFVTLNREGFQDVALVAISKSAITTPIAIVHVTDARLGPALALPRTLIVLEDGAQATIVERYLGLGGESLTSAVSEISLGENAVLHHLKWADPKSYHIGVAHARLAENAQLHTFVLSLSGAIQRSELTVELARSAQVRLDALMLARGEQLADLQTLIDHRAPHGMSRQVVKGVLAERGQSVFDGRIRVTEGAIKTDSGQQNKTLLLSKDASAVSKPHLEIHTDDVKCAHGATCGQLSSDALFYLRSRGIDEGEAQALLAYGFAREVIESIDNEALRTQAENALKAWLEDVA